MNRSWDELLPIEEAILEVGLEKADKEDPSFYAYGMARELEKSGKTSTLTGNGTMYKALRRMEATGWLKSYYEDAQLAAAEGKRPRRTLYEVTSDGEEAFKNAPRAVVRGGAVVPKRQKSGIRLGQIAALPQTAGP